MPIAGTLTTLSPPAVATGEYVAYEVIVAELLDAIPKLRSLARALTASVAEADDLVQDACLRVLERREGLSNAHKLRGWMVRLLKNIHIDLVRRWDRKTAPYVEDALPAAIASPIGRWRLVSDESLAASVRRLPSSCRAAWELADAKRMTHRDVARELNVAPATVGTRVYRARRALRKMLDERAFRSSPFCAADGATTSPATGATSTSSSGS
jgi:RNA polymerase sigma-70 factor (ECF subfamily)